MSHSEEQRDKRFLEALKGKDNPYHDYYIWRKGKGKNGKNRC